MIRFIVFLSIPLGFFSNSVNFKSLAALPPENLECMLNVTAKIIQDGFHGEEHKVTTKDGYILTIHRVSLCANTTRVVILLHGLFFGSMDWIVLGSDNALAKKCYDVWLMNFRGNDYSTEHVQYDPLTYWDFSFHEMGLYDVPGLIDYVLSETKKSIVSIVGHSQGGTAAFVSAILNPDLNHKIDVMCALGPAVYLGNTQNLAVKILAATTELPVKTISGATTYQKFLITDAKEVLATFCLNSMPEMCETILNFGFDLSEANKTIIPSLPCHTPSGTSMKQHTHFYQSINCGCFRQYDYGLFENFVRYKSFEPPNYDLSKFKIPVFVIGGTRDKMVVPVDVHQTASKLPNLIGERYVDVTHTDFLYGIYARSLVYEPLMEECLNAKILA